MYKGPRRKGRRVRGGDGGGRKLCMYHIGDAVCRQARGGSGAAAWLVCCHGSRHSSAGGRLGSDAKVVEPLAPALWACGCRDLGGEPRRGWVSRQAASRRCSAWCMGGGLTLPWPLARGVCVRAGVRAGAFEKASTCGRARLPASHADRPFPVRLPRPHGRRTRRACLALTPAREAAIAGQLPLGIPAAGYGDAPSARVHRTCQPRHCPSTC